MHLNSQHKKQNGIASQYTFYNNGNSEQAAPNAAGNMVLQETAGRIQHVSKLSDTAQLAQAFVGSGLNVPDTA